jgi:hypothetical protein
LGTVPNLKGSWIYSQEGKSPSVYVESEYFPGKKFIKHAIEDYLKSLVLR